MTDLEAEEYLTGLVRQFIEDHFMEIETIDWPEDLESLFTEWLEG